MSGQNSDNGLHLVISALNDIRATQLEQAEVLGGMRSDIANLAGPQGRVTKLESQNTRQWWAHTISPVLMLAYAVARKLGVAI